MMAGFVADARAAEQEFLIGKQPTGRFISAESVAALMVFLCGPTSRDITGAALPIDGALVSELGLAD